MPRADVAAKTTIMAVAAAVAQRANEETSPWEQLKLATRGEDIGGLTV